MSTANAIPTASIFTVGSGLITKLVKTTIMMRAAVVITLVELRGGLGGQHRRTQCVAVPFGDEHGAEARRVQPRPPTRPPSRAAARYARR